MEAFKLLCFVFFSLIFEQISSTPLLNFELSSFFDELLEINAIVITVSRPKTIKGTKLL
jgi:hypothetical protein